MILFDFSIDNHSIMSSTVLYLDIWHHHCGSSPRYQVICFREHSRTQMGIVTMQRACKQTQFPAATASAPRMYPRFHTSLPAPCGVAVQHPDPSRLLQPDPGAGLTNHHDPMGTHGETQITTKATQNMKTAEKPPPLRITYNFTEYFRVRGKRKTPIETLNLN